MIRLKHIAMTSALLFLFPVAAFAVSLDQSPAQPGQWGYRPVDGSTVAVNPPSFSWRPQHGITWEFQCIGSQSEPETSYNVKGLKFNVHCPPRTFLPGKYQWRYRGVDSKGNYTQWSKFSKFKITSDAVSMPMPEREELLCRVPKTHPRLFVRPENIDELRSLAKGRLKDKYNSLVKQCEKIIKNPPDTTEPIKYPTGTVRNSDPWRKIWWGNRTYTSNALNSAAMLGFTYQLDGNEKYGNEAKRILMECAKWEPKGSTGYRYNDEAGMPYNYYFSRTYTFINDLLSEEQKQICRNVMKIRGKEMYDHLCPRHFWQPYGSHQNRAWHFLGEVAIAFMGEIEAADDWLWFAMNVFYNTYPVWCDDDGGWHEGQSYWSSYQDRFTWWADIMREAMGIDAFDKPYYSKAGYYAMYLTPPNKTGAGFGDLTAKRSARSNRILMSTLAAQSGNEYWQWYVDQIGGTAESGGYIGFIRGALPKVKAKAPDDLDASRLFEGTGQAYLNTQITNAEESVQVVFKSSPFGTQSHGYEANNSLLLWAYGKRMLIRSGYRDSYGSDHHKKWMWSTRSVNNITVNGKGQGRRTSKATGQIISFKTTDEIDIVVGDAAKAYEKPLERYTRAIIFIKPELIIVYDRLLAKEPSTYEYWLHAINKMDIKNQNNITIKNGDVICDINFLAPQNLVFAQTDQYDPNPRPRITLREWHLTASSAAKQKQVEFVTLYRIHRENQVVPYEATLQKQPGGYILNAKISDGQVTVLLPINETSQLNEGSVITKGKIAVEVVRTGKPAIIVQEAKP